MKASGSHAVTSALFNPSSPADLSPKEQFFQELEQWAKEVERVREMGYGEQRDIAVHRIKDAYEREAFSLTLDSLNLSTLPDLSALKKLWILFINKNKLPKLPDNLPQSLKELYVSENRLIALTDCFPDSLSRLDVSNNQLTSLNYNFPINLYFLDASANSIKEWPSHLLINLKELYIKNNYLKELVFNSFSKLEAVNASHNFLERLSFEFPASLRKLDVSHNRLIDLPEQFSKSFSKLRAKDNPLIFKPVVAASIHLSLSNDLLPTKEREFERGCQSLLNFSHSDFCIPGAISDWGTNKLQLMLSYANQQIAEPKWAWKNSAAINQLLYQSSRLAKFISARQYEEIKEQAALLQTHYLNTENVRSFFDDAMNIVMPSDLGSELFTFVAEDGQRGLSITRSCYEKNIFNLSSMHRSHPYEEINAGILFHQVGVASNVLQDPEDLKPFIFFNGVYKKYMNQNALRKLFPLFRMNKEYVQRFSEVLTVKSIGVLARNRGNTIEEKHNVQPYKMVDDVASRYLFEVFSALVNVPANASEDSLANINATLTNACVAHICGAFSEIKEKYHAALMFVLAMIFTKYSSSEFFGTDDNSPIALRFFANALLNKFQSLDRALFVQVEGDRLKRGLLNNQCTNALASLMQLEIGEHAILRHVYRDVMPLIWR